MSKTTKQKPRTPKGWCEGERQSFGDGLRLRASTIHGKRTPAPSVDEWGDLEDWLDD
jgi:hypothetical protein